MWVFTIDGFYSAVEHQDDPSSLLVRCRAVEDAQHLADWLAERGQPTEVQHTPTADYWWRMVVPRAAFGQYLVAATEALDYPNFKDAVARSVGLDRAHVYGEVWVDLLALQDPKDLR